jgi:hypothetical protein
MRLGQIITSLALTTLTRHGGMYTDAPQVRTRRPGVLSKAQLGPRLRDRPPMSRRSDLCRRAKSGVTIGSSYA